MEEKTTMPDKQATSKAVEGCSKVISVIVAGFAVNALEAAISSFLWNRYGADLFELRKITFMQAFTILYLVTAAKTTVRGVISNK